MKNVLIYSRVCKIEQAENGHEFESQNKKLLRFCKKNGWNVLETFNEHHEGRGFNRPVYNQLFNCIKTGKTKVDMVLFTQWSRFSRDYTNAVNEIERLQKLGIGVNAIEQWIDLTMPENHYLLPIYLCSENTEISNNKK